MNRRQNCLNRKTYSNRNSNNAYVILFTTVITLIIFYISQSFHKLYLVLLSPYSTNCGLCVNKDKFFTPRDN